MGMWYLSYCIWQSKPSKILLHGIKNGGKKMEKPKYYTDDVKEIGKGFIVIERRINLPEGKTTVIGQYPKLNTDDKCVYPERACCNHGDFFTRCEYMQYDNSESASSSTRWKCTFKK